MLTVCYTEWLLLSSSLIGRRSSLEIVLMAREKKTGIEKE